MNAKTNQITISQEDRAKLDILQARVEKMVGFKPTYKQLVSRAIANYTDKMDKPEEPEADKKG